MSLLPKLACPMCWPAYAGLLSSLGLGFLISTVYLLPITTAFLLMAIAALGFHARARRGRGPMLLGVMAGGAILCGKFFLDSNAVMYGGVAMLVAASTWNSWPMRPASGPRCAPAGDEFIQLGAEEKSR